MLTRSVRRHLAWVVTLLYCVGVLMPSAALAFGDGAASAYCFDEIAEHVAALHVHVHVHADGTVHHHLDHAALDGHYVKGDDPKQTGHDHVHDANCCGAFGFPGVLPVHGGTVAERTAFHVQPAILIESLVGCGPDRIDRPPICSLPM